MSARFACALVVLVVLASGVVPAEPLGSPDRTAPALLVLPHELDDVKRTVRLRVRATDDGHVAQVRAHVRAPGEGEWRPYELSPAGADEWSAELALDARGGALRFWVEATDAAGNGPQVSGTARAPYLVRVAAAGGDGAPAGTSAGTANVATAEASTDPRALIALVPVLLALVLIGMVRQRRALERRFWIAVLSPLAGLRGAERARVLRELCARPHPHPVKGETTIRRSDALVWLEGLGPELVAAPAAEPTSVTPAVSIDDKTLRELEDDMFWLSLLSPLLELDPESRAREITRLAARTHHHPQRGKRMFDRNTLNRHLRRVRALDAEAVASRLATLRPQSAPDPDAGDRTAGYTLVELLVTVALIGLSVVISAVYLRPLEAPVRNGGEIVEGTLRRARARAISSTTVHRVRPSTADTLLVETSTGCSATSWAPEAELGARLPAGVEFDSTSWSVCFTTRGIASDNVTFALEHPQFDSVSLEVMLGGAVRWIE